MSVIAAPEAPAAGERARFGRYELLSVLGRGGMGEVMRARVVGLAGVEREVALKRVRPDLTTDARFAARLVEEARLAARLTHPNLVTLLEFGREGDEYFLALELVEGADLRSAVAMGGPVPSAVVAYVGREVARALAFLHRGAGQRAPIVHGDVKPANVLVGLGGVVKLADLGVARAAELVDGAGGSGAGSTAAFLPPWRAGGEASAPSPRDDRYALGLTMLDAATGAQPRGDAVRPEVAKLPAPLGVVVARLLALPGAGTEPATGEALVEAIDAAVHALGAAAGEHAEAATARWLDALVAAPGVVHARGTPVAHTPSVPTLAERRSGGVSTALSALQTAVPSAPAPPTAAPPSQAPPAVAAPAPETARRPAARVVARVFAVGVALGVIALAAYAVETRLRPSTGSPVTLSASASASASA
ncbi:MAG TPA: serine/threonine-protein kinase, partial [Myxococcota bacterium]|nr:serine/threonine-protein kinase [Myxococcota bacterium]